MKRPNPAITGLIVGRVVRDGQHLLLRRGLIGSEFQKLNFKYQVTVSCTERTLQLQCAFAS